MQDFRLLKFVDLFRPLLTRLGINYPIMRLILQMKLTTDTRRAPTMLNQNRKKGKDPGNLFLKSLGLYLFLGVFLIPIILIGDSYFFQVSLIFGVVMFMLMMSMISDFSTVLLDLRDKSILAVRPIDNRTLHAAKTIHIGLYLILLTASLAAPVTIAGTVRYGLLFCLIMVPELVLLNLFVIIFTGFIYLFILKFFDGERLKDVINYVQISLSLVIVIGYQLLIRVFEFTNLHVSVTLKWWTYLVPPLWFGAPFEWLLAGHQSTQLMILSMCALVIPIVSFWLYVKSSPAFERALQKMASQGESREKKQNALGYWFSRVICPQSKERIFFQFAGLMMRKDRPFKLRVYPTLGLALIFPFLFTFTSLQDSSWQEIASGKIYLNFYFSLIMIPTAVSMLKYSGAYKGAWLFGTAPACDKRTVIAGTIKAFIVRLFLPVYLLLSLMILVLFGVRALPDLIAGFLSACLYSAIAYRLINQSALPFSESFDAIQQSDGWKVIPLLLLIAPFAIVHVVISLLLPVWTIFAYALLILILNLIVWRTIFRKRPKVLEG